MTHFFRIGLNATENTESMRLLAKVHLEKGIKALPSLQNGSVRPLSVHDVKIWMANWKKIGFIL